MLSFNLLKTPISLLRRVCITIKDIVPNNWFRTIATGRPSLCEAVKTNDQQITENNNTDFKERQPLSLCLEYMESSAYKTTYGDKPVWSVYVRNFKGGIPPETRKSCLAYNGKVRTGSPCPICRDEYLLPHYTNIKLLKQFISPYGGEIIETKKTGVCQVQQFNLIVAIKKAQNYGLLTFAVPHRFYDYSLYNKK